MNYKLNLSVVLLLVSFLSLPIITTAQQLFNYNNYMDNMGPVNPTWYLSDASPSLHSVVRKQWAGIDGAPTSLVLNGHLPFNASNSATGLNLAYDSFGPEKSFNMSAFFAKAVRLSEGGEHLSASLSLGLSRYEALYSKLSANDPAFRDDILGTTGTVGLGIMFYKPEEYFIGVSMPQVSMQQLMGNASSDSYKFNTPFYAMAGYLTKLDEVFKLKPVIMGTFIKGLPAHYDFSATLYIQDALGLGLNYSSQRELGTRVSFFPSTNLRLGYAYQFGVTSYAMASKGNSTHEIGLGYRFGEVMKKFL